MSAMARKLARDAREFGVSVPELIAEFAALDDKVHERSVADHVARACEQLANGINCAKGTSDTYNTYLVRFADMFGDRRVVDITLADLQTFTEDVVKKRKKRVNTNDAVIPENCVGALRHLFTLAQRDRVRSDNPALEITKPPRTPKQPRHGLTRAEIIELVNVTKRDSNDPDLDVLLMRFAFETGCRREGLLNLTVDDIDANNNRVKLCEKKDKRRWQPVTAELVVELFAHVNNRPAAVGERRVFRQRRRGKQQFHQPIGRKRFEQLTDVWKNALLWADARGVSLHWVRHTVVTNIDRIAGLSVASGFAGHDPATVTLRYTTARAHEIRNAFDTYVGFNPSDSDEYVLPFEVFRRNEEQTAASDSAGTGCTEPKSGRNRLHGRNIDSVSVTKCSVQANLLQNPSSEHVSGKKLAS